MGSTSNILNFILSETEKAALSNAPSTLSVILGTEAGMITAIVRQVQAELQRILAETTLPLRLFFQWRPRLWPKTILLGIIPGVAGGEGVRQQVAVRPCPYMKMKNP